MLKGNLLDWLTGCGHGSPIMTLLVEGLIIWWPFSPGGWRPLSFGSGTGVLEGQESCWRSACAEN